MGDTFSFSLGGSFGVAQDRRRPPLQQNVSELAPGFFTTNLNQREMEFREEQKAFPSTTWERGEV